MEDIDETCGDALSVNANRMKQLLNRITRCLNHVFLLEQRKITGMEKPHEQTVAWSYDTEELVPVGEMSEALMELGGEKANCLEILVFGKNWTT